MGEHPPPNRLEEKRGGAITSATVMKILSPPSPSPLHPHPFTLQLPRNLCRDKTVIHWILVVYSYEFFLFRHCGVLCVRGSLGIPRIFARGFGLLHYTLAHV